MSELYSTLFFGDNPEFEDFLAQDLEGFLGQLASSHESSRDLLFPLLVLMGDEDDASMMTELATDDGDPQTQPANAEFVERLETVKIEESGLECSICLDQLSIGSEEIISSSREPLGKRLGFQAKQTIRMSRILSGHYNRARGEMHNFNFRENLRTTWT
ncbi:hypothetical protein GH714_017570 [Hevea brasiliensis]|uniref:Uncharacterized protein n=1 Tax=Hevea brasiliensis TaxID=3981 RepID=A0A6A6LAQ2_HEVBR|nr:hypothetical protein GH714_017570 [Hevea brasiliensis]